PILYLLVFDGVHDTMYPNKRSRAFGRKTASQHQRSATILHIGYEVLFCMAAKPTCDVCCQKALFWSHLTRLYSPSISQAGPNLVQQTLNELQHAFSSAMESCVVSVHTGHDG